MTETPPRMTPPPRHSTPPPLLGGADDLVFPWTRYWTPTNKPIQLGASAFWGGDSDGFLADPEDDFFGARANAHLLSTESLLTPRPGCFVLCGEPGMGKSRALTAALAGAPSPAHLTIEFRAVPTWEHFKSLTTGSPRWRDWVAGSGLLTLTVDGVDEGLIKIPGFIDALAGLLKTEPVARLQLLLACRSLEWPRSEGQGLLDLWETNEDTPTPSGLFELCPLRESDVSLAAERYLSGGSGPAGETRARAFLREIKHQHLIALGSRPLTLKMLLREFADGTGAFPASHRDLYRRCIGRLLSEHDPARRTRLRNHQLPRLHVSENQRRSVAGRIAALMMLCGRSTVTDTQTFVAEDADLSLSEIATGSERIGETPFEVSPALVEAVLETPLFWPKNEGRFGFYHQTFAECLAAEYLAPLPFPQLRTLLFQRDAHGEHVHPQLGELAAWIACDSQPLLEHLLAHDPEVLLRSDVSKVPARVKAALVDGILEKARAEELFDNDGVDRFLHTLRHPDLARQLRGTFHNRSANRVARRLALGIAAACRLEDMLPDAIRCLRDPGDSAMHSVAAGALDDLATPQTARRLIPLLRLPGLRASERLCALHALLKHRVWSLGEALPFTLRVLDHDSISGHILVQHATPQDAESLLRHCLKWRGCFSSTSRLRPLVHAAHRLAIERIREPKIRLLLARVWWKARREHRHQEFCQPDFPEKNTAPALPDLLKCDPILRRRFLADLALAAKGRLRQNQHRLLVELIQPEDFEAILESACIGSRWRRQHYAELAACYFWPPDSATRSGQLFEALERSPELRAVFPQMRMWVIGAEDSQAAASKHYQAERERLEMEAQWNDLSGAPQPIPEDVWRNDLARLTPEQPTAGWLTLAHNLSYCGTHTHAEGKRRHDITTTPGWKFHDDAARAQIVGGARRLLLEVLGNPEHVMGRRCNFDANSYKALYLLREEIERDPALANAVRQHWLPIIYDEFSNGDAHHLEMMALAYRLDAERMRFFLRDEIIRQSLTDGGHSYVLREFGACWDAALVSSIIDLIEQEIRHPQTLRDLIDYLAEHDSPAAYRAWTRLRRRHRRTPEPAAFAAATAALAGFHLLTFWEDLWSELVRNEGFARQVFLALGRRDQRRFLRTSENAKAARLAELYLFLLKLFPRQEDPPTPRGVHSPSSHMEIARLRDELPAALASLGTLAAVAELERVARSVPAEEAIWIRWRKRDALVALRRGSWRPPTTESVLALIEKSERRWIQDEDDLMALVLESLERLQNNLRASPNSWRNRFWVKTAGRTSTKTPRIKPVGEVEMSLTIVQWLQAYFDANKGLSVLRELQVQHHKRTDIEVSAVAVGSNPRSQRAIQVVIEVKGHWHSEVKSAHQTQLVRDYLRGCGRTHGVYLVVWTKSEADPRRSPLKARTPEDARTELATLVAPFDGKQQPETLRTFVLDARTA